MNQSSLVDMDVLGGHQFPHDLGVNDTMISSDQFKRELALHILEDQMGDRTRDVAKVLLSAYNVTLDYLVDFFDPKKMLNVDNLFLTAIEIQDILFQLQQHGCLIGKFDFQITL